MRNVGEIDGITVRITDHALMRMVEMGMTPEEIKAIILTPEEVYESTKYPGSFCHRTGEYSISMHREGDILVVRTALYGTMVAWFKAQREGKLPPDRPVKVMKSLKRW